MATFNIELNKKPVRGGKGHTLRLRITEKKQHARVNLIYAVTPDQFNPKAKNGNFVRSFHKNHVKINTYLNDKIQGARDVYAEMDKKGEFISARTIKEKLTGKAALSFTQYLKGHISHLLEMDQIGSHKKYQSTLTIINEFASRDDILFQDIDVRFLKDMEKHLLKTGRKQSTIRGYYVKIRALFNMAIQDGILALTDNPFTSFKIKSGVVIKDRLTLDEIDRIVQLNLKEDSVLFHVRNLFLFSFYTGGMRISDSLFLKWESIQENRVTYVMHKTGKPHSLKLVPNAIRIIEYYDQKDKQSDYVFPILDTRYNLENPQLRHNQLSSKTALVNKYLKELARSAEIGKRITSHTARHSFADIARTKIDNPIDIMMMLGHSDFKTTRDYMASSDAQRMDDALNKIFKD